ncbi:hypothetical protein Q6316_30365, partial [Klebsiella pneumoniae]|uniref:hypothetical protein n=1 Tax=Klebsiella pneumoniae TaxID=573 RepID=UPI0027321E05
FFELGAVQKEEHDEEGVSLLAVRLPRSELNRWSASRDRYPLHIEGLYVLFSASAHHLENQKNTYLKFMILL